MGFNPFTKNETTIIGFSQNDKRIGFFDSVSVPHQQHLRFAIFVVTTPAIFGFLILEKWIKLGVSVAGEEHPATAILMCFFWEESSKQGHFSLSFSQNPT